MFQFSFSPFPWLSVLFQDEGRNNLIFFRFTPIMKPPCRSLLMLNSAHFFFLYFLRYICFALWFNLTNLPLTAASVTIVELNRSPEFQPMDGSSKLATVWSPGFWIFGLDTLLPGGRSDCRVFRTLGWRRTLCFSSLVFALTAMLGARPLWNPRHIHVDLKMSPEPPLT